MAFALTLTLRGIPQFYYGDEIGMREATIPTTGELPWRLREDTKNHFRRRGTREQQENIFVCSDVAAFATRTRGPEREAALDLFSDEASYVFLRESEEERVLVTFHNSAQPRGIAVYIGGHTGAERGSSIEIIRRSERGIER